MIFPALISRIKPAARILNLQIRGCTCSLVYFLLVDLPQKVKPDDALPHLFGLKLVHMTFGILCQGCCALEQLRREI